MSNDCFVLTMETIENFNAIAANVFFILLKSVTNTLSDAKIQNLETIEMPEDAELKFKNYHKMHRAPYAIYADFECLLEKVDLCLPDPNISSTTAYQKHTPCGYGVAEVFGCCSDKLKRGDCEVDRGADAVQKFFDRVLSWSERYQEQYKKQVPINMTLQDRLQFNQATACNICHQALEDDKVADHCHFCGTYRGPCHSNCNVRYRLNRDIVVVFHNVRRYDGHLLLNSLATAAQQQTCVQINVIPKGFDNYLTFSLRFRQSGISWNLKFIDSFEFLSAPLAKLVDNLRDKGMDRFSIMNSYFTSAQLPLLLRKGIYPYDYMDIWSRFDETQLPSAIQFKSTLSGEDISDSDYQHAQTVWECFGLQNLGQYQDLYLLTDVLLLADIFENFRQFCLTTYQLDPAHYFTAPSFSWDACLKHTNAKLELLTDPDMYAFMESGIRGGISTITHRYAKANNPLVPGFVPQLPTSYIMYLDCCNLYGRSMTFSLPYKDFRWVDPTTVDIINCSDDSATGYIVEVDLEYPKE